MHSLDVQTDDEYSKMLGYRSGKLQTSQSSRNGRAPRHRRALYETYYNTVDVKTLPSCVNWTDKGWVGPVLNQVRENSSIVFILNESTVHVV